MYRFAFGRRQCAALVALVPLVAFEHVSFAQTPRIEVPRALSFGVPGADADVTPQRAAERAGDAQPMFLPPVSTQGFVLATERLAKVRTFVECHISRHPLLGMRSAELACPLLFAAASSVAPLVPPDSPAPADTTSTLAD
jgi:hypothetical protein